MSACVLGTLAADGLLGPVLPPRTAWILEKYGPIPFIRSRLSQKLYSANNDIGVLSFILSGAPIGMYIPTWLVAQTKLR
jgi:hypothetical protein